MDINCITMLWRYTYGKWQLVDHVDDRVDYNQDHQDQDRGNDNSGENEIIVDMILERSSEGDEADCGDFSRCDDTKQRGCVNCDEQ